MRNSRSTNGQADIGREMSPMPNEIEGATKAPANARFAIVVARWNSLVTDRLSDAAAKTLVRCGADNGAIDLIHVPGSFELPIVADAAAASGQYAAVICLGAVIQGDTDHDKYINSAVASGLMSAGTAHRVPVTFGVLTCSTMEQALNRAGGKVGNKGEEAALAALETLDVLRQIKN